MLSILNSFHRPLFLAMAGFALPALMAACAQTTADPVASPSAAVQGHIDRQVIPFWKAQQAGLAQTIASPPSPEYQSAWQALDAAERTLPTKDLLAETMRGTTGHERNARMIWLRWRILNGHADGRYAYTYAYLLSITSQAGSTKPMLQEAATFLFQARIAVAVDGARCADGASPSVVQQGIEKLPMLAPVMTYLASAPASEVGNALTNALAIEQVRGEGPPQAWLCGLGAATALQAINHSSASWRKDGANIVIDTSGVTPGYVQDALWRQRRHQVFNEQLLGIAAHVRGKP